MSNLISLRMTDDKIIEEGMDLIVQCIKFEVEDKLEDPFITLRLNVLGVIYGATISKHEANDQKNIQDCWKAIIQDFGIMHMLGQSKRVQDGTREYNYEELKIMGEKNAIK